MDAAESSDLHLGIDLGTSGCRACAIDRAGNVCANAAVELPQPQRDAATSEQDPLIWWRGVEDTLAAVFERVDAGRVRSIAIDGTSATLLATDAHGEPLAAALMYNDSRCRSEAERIAALAPADSAARGASSSLAKALYLQERYPRTCHLLHQADWLSNRLAGRFGFSDENNALKLGYDPVARGWPAWLQALGLPPDWLPRVGEPGSVLDSVDGRWCRAWGLRTDTRVVRGTTDSTAAFLATGADRPGEAVTSLGSTLVLKVISPRPVFAAQFGVYSHRIHGLWIAGGASNSGGAVLRQYFSQAQLDAMTPQLDPAQPSGLDYYPLPDRGERFPVHDPDLEPRLQPRPQDAVQFFHGLLEGMARIECQGYRLLQRLGAPYPTDVRSVGGGAVNAAWGQIRERLLGVPLLPARHRDAAYGSALLARRGVAGV